MVSDFYLEEINNWGLEFVYQLFFFQVHEIVWVFALA